MSGCRSISGVVPGAGGRTAFLAFVFELRLVFPASNFGTRAPSGALSPNGELVPERPGLQSWCKATSGIGCNIGVHAIARAVASLSSEPSIVSNSAVSAATGSSTGRVLPHFPSM